MCKDSGPVNGYGLTGEGVRDRAEDRYGSALWYAWGMADSGAVPGLTLDHGWTFASDQRADALAFYSGQAGSLGSILGDWRTFLAAEGLSQARGQTSAHGTHLQR